MKKLERSQTDRVFAGVCGGVGRYFAVDSDIVRAAWILSVLTGGVGILPYAAAFFLVPKAEGEAPVPGDRAARNAGLALIAVAGILFLAQVGFDRVFPLGFPFWSWRFVVPLLLLIAGVLLVWPRARQTVGFSSERKLRRSVSDRVLGGVAGGIGREIGLDSNVVRLACVLAAVLTAGLAVILYILLIVVLPEETPVSRSEDPPEPPEAPPAADPAPDQAPGTDDR